MTISKVMSLSEAVNMIKDGDQLITGGWTVLRRPMAAAYEIVRQKKRNLHLVCGTPGTDTDLLVGAGCVSLSEQAYIGHEKFGHPYNFRRAIEVGTEASGFTHDDCSLQMSWLRLLAASMGVPFLPTSSVKGSDILNPDYDTMKGQRGHNPKLPKEKFITMKDPFWEGHEYTLVPAACPDVAIIHVHEAAADGTARIFDCPFGDRVVAMAAKKTIITTEKIVPRDRLTGDPSLNAIPGMYVTAVVEVPFGAHPTQMASAYDYDPIFYDGYVKASKSVESFQAWLEQWIYGTKNQQDYLEKLGQEVLENITPNAEFGYNPTIRRTASNDH